VTEHSIIRVLAVLYGIIVFGVIVLIWLNASAPDVSKNIGIMFAALLPIAIAVLPYTNKDTKSSEYNFVLFYNSKSQTLETTGYLNPYFLRYGPMFSNLSKAPEGMMGPAKPEFFAPTIGLDIIEKGIIDSFHGHFFNHWAMERIENRTPSSISIRGRPYSKETGTSVSIEDIRKLFSHNKLISSPDILTWEKLSLPPGCEIKARQEERQRIIRFKDKYLSTEISIIYTGFHLLQQPVWGLLPLDREDMFRYYELYYLVNLKTEFSRFRRYSPAMEDHERWYENVAEMLSKYDWANVNRRIQENMQRKAIYKTLSPEWDLGYEIDF
jgi:hypothetical protein